MLITIPEYCVDLEEFLDPHLPGPFFSNQLPEDTIKLF